MAQGPHKGTELSNVSRTWEKNEREREQNGDRGETPAASELDRMVSKEAKEYDNASAEDNVLDGERASLKDTDANGDR